MTIPAARKAMKACGIMNDDGTPCKEEFAITKDLDDGGIYYRWNAEVVRNAFSKAGLCPDRLTAESFLLSRSQAETKLDSAFFAMGNAAGLGDVCSSDNTEISWACGIHESAEFNDIHAIGGPCAIQFIEDKAGFAVFERKLTDVSVRYRNACIANATDEKMISEIEFQFQVIQKISAWLMKVFCKL